MRRALAVVMTVALVGGCSSGSSARPTPVPPSTTPASPSTDAAQGSSGSTAISAPVDSITDAVSSSGGADSTTSHFGTLAVGATLPDDAECSALVRPTPEIRPENTPFNSVRGEGPPQTPLYYSRVTGDFTGTTDEIIQWAACKWGIDEDVVRAQVAKESGWFQQMAGDFTSDPALCVPGHPIGADGHDGECPESIGVMQARYQYMTPSFPMAAESTAYNLDVALAARRSCFEGNEPWLNTVERGEDYVSGDLWGCVGMWFAGRWHTEGADTYEAAVREYFDTRIWETSDFRSWTAP